jgi:alkylation response protein AidB-like acyl-CoA dehydrogenase
MSPVSATLVRPSEPVPILHGMGRLLRTEGLTDVQREILAVVRAFVDEQVLPVATELEHKDEYPTQIVEGLKQMGVFGLMVPEQYGGLGESLLTYALVVEELSRGWLSLSGIVNTHFIVAYLLAHHGTPEQQRRLLPRMATGEVRGAFSMSEPHTGSDVSAIRTRAVRDRPAPDGELDGRGTWTITGQKMWLTNGGSSTLVAVLTRTDLGAASVYRNMTTFLVEKVPGSGPVAPGVLVPGKIETMGYKGVDTTELVFDGYRTTDAAVLGGVPGRGFYQMMDGVEVGRVNVAARACGVAMRAFELAIAYAQQRETFGKPIAQHQAVQFRLAEMATKVEAAHQMTVMAARLKDSGRRNDLEAGMAKYLASEYCRDVVEDSFRIHGGYGYSTEYEIERLYREAPMLLIGEGTADVQRMIIGRRLLEEYALPTR